MIIIHHHYHDHHYHLRLGLGFAISSVAPNGETANALGVPILIIFILFGNYFMLISSIIKSSITIIITIIIILTIIIGGFYIAVDQLPIVANWIPYICIFRWGYEALMINEFKGGDDEDVDDLAGFFVNGMSNFKYIFF
jgi:hypothetical protein